MKLIYSRSNLPLSFLICLRTKSKWSHVGVILSEEGDGLVLESTLTHGGVQLTTLKIFKSRAKAWEVTELRQKTDPTKNIMDYVNPQIGKKYDLLGAIGIGFGRDWQKDSDWCCSEITGYLLLCMDIDMEHTKNYHFFTPADCRKIPQDVLDRSVF